MELADEIKANPESGARRLIAEHGDRLFAVALWLCGCEADAMRLVNMTFMRAIERIALFTGGASLYTWLYSILMNFWRMDMRAAKTDVVTFTDSLPERADDRPDPFETLAAKADAEAVRAAVRRLPAHYRAVAVFRFFEDMTVPEIAQIMHLAEGTVKFRLHKAKRLLRRLLAQTVDVPYASNGNGGKRQ